MKLSQAKDFLPLVQAAAEGKAIQRYQCGRWIDCDHDWNIDGSYQANSEVRIKPTPKLRPWTAEEGVGKIVRNRDTKNFGIVLGFDAKDGEFVCPGELGGIRNRRTAEYLLVQCDQLDGSPCGVLE